MPSLFRLVRNPYGSSGERTSVSLLYRSVPENVLSGRMRDISYTRAQEPKFKTGIPKKMEALRFMVRAVLRDM